VAGTESGRDKQTADSHGRPDDAVADLLAENLARRGGPVRQRAAEILHELGAIDRAVYDAVASVPAPALDQAMRRLSRSADRSRLWFGIAGALALTGPSGRRGQPRDPRDRRDVRGGQPRHQDIVRQTQARSVSGTRA
jgi:hypothetical protein